MSNFYVGDKIIVVKLIEISNVVKVGDIGIVSEIDVQNSYPIRVEINGEMDYGFKEEEIQLLLDSKIDSSYIEIANLARNLILKNGLSKDKILDIIKEI